MKTVVWTDLDDSARADVLARPEAQTDRGVTDSVLAIVNDVQLRGDAALKDYTERFDGVSLEALEVSQAALEAAWGALPASDKAVLEQAKANIEAFHAPQRPEKYTVETMPGVVCRREPKALRSAGMYVPGGTAPLVSTVLMLAVPAAMAGVRERVMVSPPGKDGQINAGVLAAAHLAGVTRVFCVGGAQAVAALAYGTESVPRCAKVFGPGNAYVAAAKALVSAEASGPAVDLPAGPSEVMVVADGSADARFVAADLLAQAEHDVMAQVVALVDSAALAEAVEVEVRAQIETLSRKDIARASLANARVIVAGAEDFVGIIEAYAPEHLILQCAGADRITEEIASAGSVFIGPWTPESVGDYASGTNHTLPTGGAARSYSGVNLESFYTLMTVQELSRDGLERLGPIVERMAEMEGLDAHGRAVAVRLER